MKCLSCGCSDPFEIRSAGQREWACSDCIDLMVLASSRLHGNLTGRGVDHVFGRLKWEIDTGWLNLDPAHHTRYRFDPEVDGRPLGVANVLSVNPGVIRMERMWNLATDPAKHERRFIELTDKSLIVLREFTPSFDFSVFRKDEKVARNAKGVLDAVAFTPSEIRISETVVDRGESRPPQRYEIVTMKVNYVDLERVMDIPA